MSPDDLKSALIAQESDGIGRLPEFDPVSIVDIGSNSVRMIIYDAARRSPTPVYNEKILCGLGRGVALTGAMDQANIDHAIATLARFHALNVQMGVSAIHAVATAAVREADNGPEFVALAQQVLGAQIKVLTGKGEARLSGFGVLAGIPDADGLVGDLGGGSLELIEVKEGSLGKGVTLPLGPLRLMDLAGASRKQAKQLIDQAFDGLEILEGGDNFYAVGGTWRNLAKLHMRNSNYPLSVLHQYQIASPDMRKLAKQISKQSSDELKKESMISSNRAETLPLGAEILDRLLEATPVRNVVISAYGLREGLLYSKLERAARQTDPLLAAARDLARLRARSASYAKELCDWSDKLFKSLEHKETKPERRLRHAACYMADIGWRANQDYRGEQSFNIIANAAMGGVSHAERAFLALTVFYRYTGRPDIAASPALLELVDDGMNERARILSAVQRLGYSLSGAMPGMLADIKLDVKGDHLRLSIPKQHESLWGDQVAKRLKYLGKALGKVPVVRVGGRKV